MLSSSLTGIVSIIAATTAAISGAAIVKDIGGIGAIAGRTHQASTTPAAPPETTKASVPAKDLSGFHGRRRPEETAVERRPISVAAPSPNARMPHAAAAMSSRDGNARVSSNTEHGYSRMPSGKPRSRSTG